jgi:gamma-glutamylcysteine synthetase
MESPLFDLWRQYYMGYESISLTNYYYSQMPALNFNQDEDKFKQYVNSLNNFTDTEIKELNKFGVHNSDKL